jgi:hypothetical protein
MSSTTMMLCTDSSSLHCSTLAIASFNTRYCFEPIEIFDWVVLQQALAEIGRPWSEDVATRRAFSK